MRSYKTSNQMLQNADRQTSATPGSNVFGP